MAEPNINVTIGIKAAAKAPQPIATLTFHTKLSRPFIWLMKCRYIWAVIRAKVGE